MASSDASDGVRDHPEGEQARPAAPRFARLCLVLEGATYACRDGDVLGARGSIQDMFAPLLPRLEDRHLLFGREGDSWFVFTPRTVQRPFSLDGVTLPRGERRLLAKVRHHLSLDDLRIGVRLEPQDALLARLKRLLPGSRRS